MKFKLTDFLIPVAGPINAFYRVREESEQNLQRALSKEISNREFIRNEWLYTSYVFLSGAVSTVGLAYLLDKIVR